MISFTKAFVRGMLRSVGADLVRYYDPDPYAAKRLRILADKRIDVVLDVGGSDGCWAARLRTEGYAGQIVSVEPLAKSLSTLNRQAEKDALWRAMGLALGDADSQQELHIAANSDSSSLLPMGEELLRAAPHTAYVGSEAVRTARLDSVRSELFGPQDRVFIKLDVQGYELPVLRGAVETLDQVHGLECELSIAQLYEGQALIGEAIAHLGDHGFRLVGMDAGMRHPRTGELLQLDGLFVRAD